MGEGNGFTAVVAGVGLGVVPWERGVLVVVGVHLDGEDELSGAGHLLDHAGLAFGAAQGGEEEGGEHRHDGDHHQQFDQGEAGRRGWAAPAPVHGGVVGAGVACTRKNTVVAGLMDGSSRVAQGDPGSWAIGPRGRDSQVWRLVETPRV
jgi:hypothetical protein